MLQTIEAVLDKHGYLQLSEPIELTQSYQVLVTFLNTERIEPKQFHSQKSQNILKDSIIFEEDIISPLDLTCPLWVKLDPIMGDARSHIIKTTKIHWYQSR